MVGPTARRLRRSRVAACCAVFALLLGSFAGSVVAPPRAHAAHTQAFDYTEITGLSQPMYDYETEVVRERLLLPMADGVAIYLEITRPREKRPYPTILEASPYHGTLADRDGTRIFPEPRDADGQPLGLTRYFAPRGYAVVMMDLRGTGKSQGCLDHLGPKDASDLEAVIEWVAGQPWSNGRVGMTGHSYVGSTPSLAAAQHPDGLVTIVPSAGLATMYHHQFQAGVPFFLQWAGPMFAYEQLALERHLPGGENFGKNVEDTGCGLPNSSLVSGEDQLSGRYAPWHAERDWREGATEADIPVFMVHGVNDDAARVIGMRWFTERGGRDGDKLWLGQWDHGSGCCPNRRGIQWAYALHAWFDRHLALRDVDTGPPVELFLSDGTFQGARTGDRTQVLEGDAWPVRGTNSLGLYPTTENGLAPARPEVAGSVSFTGDPTGFDDPQGTGGVDFATAPMEADTVLAGGPQLDLVASVTVPRVHLIATLYDESPDGERRRISQFAINPELREGIDTVTPVVPGMPYRMQPPGFAMAHNLREGHRLVLRVTTSDPDKVPTFATDPRVTVLTGPEGTALRVPVVPDPHLVDDTVPLQEGEPEEAGEAQATIRGSVTVPSPGAGVRTAGVTSQYLEFDVEEGKDNANLIVGAVPAMPADTDLFLQRRNADGSWSEDLASGTSGSLSEEQLRIARPEPGHYRVEVHEWAGPPALRVDLTLEFINSAGEPGPDGA